MKKNYVEKENFNLGKQWLGIEIVYEFQMSTGLINYNSERSK